MVGLIKKIVLWVAIVSAVGAGVLPSNSVAHSFPQDLSGVVDLRPERNRDSGKGTIGRGSGSRRSCN